MSGYTLVRSRRKTLALHVTADGLLEARAPLRCPLRDIERFVASKRGWIDKHIERARKRAGQRAAFALNYGDNVVLRGTDCRIQAADGPARFDGNALLVPPGLDSDGIKRAAVEAYKRYARGLLPERAAMWAARMGARPAGVKITGAATRWGSCSGKNSICFSWRLMMAADEAIDYVVAHELAHTLEHSHSPRFWAHVSRALPGYAACRAALRGLERRLERENWA